ncbi:MAG: hypothetical protein M0R77_00195 [Gammaproteobacteria bacterium]|nr:hypothetical protein [Acholeplasmataceae bacterium]MCK9528974.1 hypothetical protein [Gammaproteobacteria bacterium]
MVTNSNTTIKGSVLKVIGVLLTSVFVISGCGRDDAKIASANLSKAADNFEVMRRTVFYNGITGEYMLSIEGLCSLGKAQETNAVTVTCKTSPRQYKKHFLGLSDNVTYFSEQMDSVNVNVHHYRVVFKPQTILPSLDIRASTSDAVDVFRGH